MPRLIRIFSQMIVLLGEDFRTSQHSHHAIKIIGGEDKCVSAKARKVCTRAAGLIIRNGVRHNIECRGPFFTVCIAPESVLGRRLALLLGEEPVRRLSAGHSEVIKTHLHSLLAAEANEDALERVISSLLFANTPGEYPERNIDLRIVMVLRYIELNLHRSIHTDDLLEAVGLSESRLLHLFKSETGVTIRKYILWQRIRHAMSCLMNGYSLTDSSRHSGFSDPSHLSRTFSSMCGVSPSRLRKYFSH